MNPEDIERQEIEAWLSAKPGYLKKSALVTKLAMVTQFVKDFDENLIKECQKKLRNKHKDSFDELLEGRHTPIPITEEPKKIKKLFFDIEVSPNQVFTWSIGSKISIGPESIIKERAVICIAYKWEDDPTTHIISWNKGDDRMVLEAFAHAMNEADVIIGHNSDAFDTKWIRTRCLKHGIHLKAKFNSIDTLKLARANFRFNSNKLDYIAQFLGVGAKQSTGYDLWKDITLHNDPDALRKMMNYCVNDVIILEQVYKKLINYTPQKKIKI